MRKIAVFFLLLITAGLAWMGFIREPLPPVPEICADISEEVTMNFSIHTIDYTGLEFSLNEKPEGKGMFIQFNMSNAWKTGRPGLVVSAVRENSGYRNGMPPKKYLEDDQRKAKGGKDFSDFMKDKSGRSISSYSFLHKLVEGRDGKTYLQISYKGPAMEMLQTLEVPRPLTIPAPVSRKFLPRGIIQFQPGTVAFDSKIKGFNIPVAIK